MRPLVSKSSLVDFILASNGENSAIRTVTLTNSNKAEPINRDPRVLAPPIIRLFDKSDSDVECPASLSESSCPEPDPCPSSESPSCDSGESAIIS